MLDEEFCLALCNRNPAFNENDFTPIEILTEKWGINLGYKD